MQHTIDQKALLKFVPLDGSPVGNTHLMRTLSWSQKRYWEVRDSLLLSKELTTGKGRGGSVRRPVGSQVSLGGGTRGERKYYEPIRRALETDWAKSLALDGVIVQVTAFAGKRDTGGKWSRPDIVAMYVAKHKYSPGRTLEVVTFEVKTLDALDVTAVFEAVSHRRSATKSYVVVVHPDGIDLQDDERIEALRDVAAQYGVGIVTAAEDIKFNNWDFYLDATRNEPDLDLVDEFIDSQIQQEHRDRILKWL